MTLDEQRLRQRLHGAASQVRGDPEATWARVSRRVAQRRRRRAAAGTTAALAVLIGGAALVPGLVGQPADEVVLHDPVADEPPTAAEAEPPDDAADADPAETDDQPTDAGWQRVTVAADVTLEAPEAWEVHDAPTTQLAAGFPAGPAVLVDRQAAPLGRPGADADWPEGVAVTSATAVPEVVGEVAAKGEATTLGDVPARRLRVAAPMITDVPDAQGPIDLYVLPGVGEGLVLEVADAEGARSQEVLERFEADAVDEDGLALGVVEGDEQVLAVDADGEVGAWTTLQDPDQPLALAPAPGSDADSAVAAVRTVGDDVLVLAGDAEGAEPVWRAPLAGGEPVDWHDGVGRTPVWSPQGTHLAWLADDDRLRVTGWEDVGAVRAGAEPVLDHALPVAGLGLDDGGDAVALDRWVASERPDLLVASVEGARDGAPARDYRGLRAQVDAGEDALMVPPEPAFDDFGDLPAPAVPAEEVSASLLGDTEPVTLEPPENQSPTVLQAVRVGHHETFDRVVWELAEGDRPGVDVAYLDQGAPTDPLSGAQVDVDGEAVLLVTLDRAVDEAVERHVPHAEPYEGPTRLEGAEAVTEVVRVGEADASVTWAIGVTGEQPFDVQLLEEPRRVVVDVAH